MNKEHLKTIAVLALVLGVILAPSIAFYLAGALFLYLVALAALEIWMKWKPAFNADEPPLRNQDPHNRRN